MSDSEKLADYYGNYDEDGRLLSRHGMVEFLTTMRYIERYLQPGMRILEVGAGTGRYSHTLAQKGYRVDAVELLEHNLELLLQNTLPDEPLNAVQGDARNLSLFPDSTFDLTLVLGPMYHLFTPEDQRNALSEAIRVTKPGGILFVAYCMADASILSYGFVRGQIHNILQSCMINPETFDVIPQPWDLFKLCRPEEIAALREEFPVTPLHFVAADGYANHMRDTLAAMDDSTYQLYLTYHFATCERPELIGYSHHTLDIFRKD